MTTKAAKTGVVAYRRHPSNKNFPERGQDKHKGLQTGTESFWVHKKDGKTKQAESGAETPLFWRETIAWKHLMNSQAWTPGPQWQRATKDHRHQCSLYSSAQTIKCLQLI